MSRSNKFWFLLLVTALLFGVSGISRASTGIFMLFEDRNGVVIPGESKDPKHENWIEVLTFAQTLDHRPDRTTPYHPGIVLDKYVDRSTPTLLLLCNQGRINRRVDLEFMRLTLEGPIFYSITMSNVVVTRVTSAGFPGAERISEQIALHYEYIEWTYSLESKDPIRDQFISWWDSTQNKGGTGVPEPDNDNDGIPDGSDPDDDNDGITDAYENANGLNRFINDAADDSDNDGMSNYNEFIAGTSANNANSVFRILRTQKESGNVRVVWSSVSGKTYEVHSSDTVNGSFTFHATVLSAGTGETSTLIPAGATNKFFRIRVLP